MSIRMENNLKRIQGNVMKKLYALKIKAKTKSFNNSMSFCLLALYVIVSFTEVTEKALGDNLLRPCERLRTDSPLAC